MRKLNYMLCILTGTFLFGCQAGTNGSGDSNYHDIVVKKIDGCEYVVYIGYSQGGIIHKANCSNTGHVKL